MIAVMVAVVVVLIGCAALASVMAIGALNRAAADPFAPDVECSCRKVRVVPGDVVFEPRGYPEPMAHAADLCQPLRDWVPPIGGAR